MKPHPHPHRDFPTRLAWTTGPPQPWLRKPPPLRRALSSRGLLIINWKVVWGLTVLLTDHLTMSEPGQQEIQQWQPEHPDTVSSSAWEVTPAPQPGCTPLRAPVLSRTQAEQGAWACSSLSRAHRAGSSLRASGSKPLPSICEVRHPTLARGIEALQGMTGCSRWEQREGTFPSQGFRKWC